MRSVVTLLLLQIVAKSLGYTSLFSSGQCSIYVASFILTGPNLCGCCTLDIAGCNYILSPSRSVYISCSLVHLLCYVYFMRSGPRSPLAHWLMWRALIKPFERPVLFDVDQAICCQSTHIYPSLSHTFVSGRQSIDCNRLELSLSFVCSIAIASRAPSSCRLRVTLCVVVSLSPSHTPLLLISLGRSRCHTILG